MENPISLDFTESPLFANPATNDQNLDLENSILFGTQPNLEPESVNGEKVVRLFNGTSLKLKPKQKKSFVQLDIMSSDEMSIIDMDLLFERAKQRQNFKDCQKSIETVTTPAEKNGPNLIWTEKYRPKRFVQLCSAGNDKQYRSISHWLRKWSSVVFKEDFDETDESLDSLGRPLRKFLLISGPPGIGKTSAAHIIANQLGYRVEELNAANSMNTLPNSDVSNGHSNVVASLKLKIQNALTSNTIQAEGNKLVESKPTCLIIDEIDTAVNSSDMIRVLHDIYQADNRALNKSYRKNLNDGKSKKDKLLNRPIICIVNDAFMSNSRTYGGFNLDKLRSMSELVTFRKPGFQKNNAGVKTGGKALSSVKEYVKWVSEQEKLKLDYQEIGEVVEICEGDIRACINHLQFNGRRIETPLINGLSNKLNKDAQLSWFRLSEMLFKRDPQLDKERDFENLMHIVFDGSGKSASSSNSTLDKVIRACFNKYLDSVHYLDDNLVKPCELSDWLDFYDRLSTLNEATDYSCLVSMKIWSLFSEINPNKPKQSLIPEAKNLDFESNEIRKVNRSIIKRLASSVPTSMNVSLGGGFEMNESFGIFVLPIIYKLLSPDMSSSGSSSSLHMKLKLALSKFDQMCLEKTANIAKDFQISLESLRDTTTNQTTLEFNPNMDSLVLFNNEFASISLDTAIKQIQSKRKWFFPLLQAEFERSDLVKNFTKRKLDQSSALSNQKSQGPKKQKQSSSLEFFKGQYDGMSTQIQQAKDTVDTESSRIWVKYNEGFSNAVRKTIGWKELWTA